MSISSIVRVAAGNGLCCVSLKPVGVPCVQAATSVCSRNKYARGQDSGGGSCRRLGVPLRVRRVVSLLLQEVGLGTRAADHQ